MITEKITGLMPTFNTVRRAFVQMSIECFLNQDYPNKELIIVSQGEPVNHPDPRVREIRSMPMPLGSLRNVALAQITEGYAIGWDDDDWRHPNYLSTLANAVKPDRQDYAAYAHYKRLGCDFTTGDTFIQHRLCTTILYHVPSLRHAYPALTMAEDIMFMRGFETIVRVAMPEHYYIRFWHGGNTISKPRALWGPKTDAYKELIDGIRAGLQGADDRHGRPDFTPE